LAQAEEERILKDGFGKFLLFLYGKHMFFLSIAVTFCESACANLNSLWKIWNAPWW